MRTYEETHPWISFRFNLSKAEPTLWLSLGEAASKIEHLSKVPLQPDTAQKLHQVYLAKGAAATTAIEGNGLSESEVLAAVKGTLEVPPSKEYLKQEVENVIGIFNEIGSQIENHLLPELTPELIRYFDRKVLENLPLGEDVIPGVYREHSVLVGPDRGARAQDCPYLMDTLCAWLAGSDFHPRRGLEVVYAIIKAIVAHLYLAWIHPFGDGNGRTARLAEFHILMSAGVPAPAAHLLSNHYNQTRAEYYRQLDRASKSGGEIIPFIEYAVRGLVDGLRTQLESIWRQNWYGAWQNYIHIQFQGARSVTNARQRNLSLELGKWEWVEIDQLTHLSPEIAAQYAKRGQKTVQRDINRLIALGLAIRDGRKIRAKREIIFGSLPLQRELPSGLPLPPPTDQLPLGLMPS